MGKFLEPQEREDLLNELRSEKSRKYADRIRVILLLDEGQTYKNISKFLFIDEGTIANYRKRYKKGGLEQLINDFFKGKRTLISEEQIKSLSSHLENNLQTFAKNVIQYIEEKFKVKYTLSGVTSLLKRMNFSYKQPKSHVTKTSRAAQEEFVEKYGELTDEGAKIYFGDSTHPRFNTVVNYGWIKKGHDFTLLTHPNGTRKGLNINGAVCLGNMDVILREEESIDKITMSNLVEEIYKKEKNSKSRVVLVLDNASYNRSHYLRNYAEVRGIEIIYIPPYSPNLNPIERLWKYFKKVTLYNKFYSTFGQFRAAIQNFLISVNNHKVQFKTLLTDNFSIMGT